jgi:acyl-CoA dehydrogenase
MNAAHSSQAELDAFRATVRRFYETEVMPNWQRYAAQGQVDRALWNRAGALGLLLLDVPAAYGGADGSVEHLAVMVEEAARAIDSALGFSVHSIVSQYLLAYASEAQKRRWLPAMAKGELVGAIAMTEPGAGSDLQGIRTQARREGDDYLISGQKTFITNGQHADLVIVVAKTDPREGAKGVSLIVAETKDLAGFRRGRTLDKMGQKAQDTAELFFDDARVPADNLLGGEEGRGFGQLMNQLPYERMIVAFRAVGAMARAVELASAYAKERRAFGKSLMEFQNTRFTLAECATEVSVARAFVSECLDKLLAGRLDAPTACMAKWWTSERQCTVIDRCLQIFGGYGYMNEYPISRLYTEARVQRIYGGTSEIMKEVIARSL